MNVVRTFDNILGFWGGDRMIRIDNIPVGNRF